MPKITTAPDYRFDPNDTASFTMNMPKKLRKQVLDHAKSMRISSSGFIIIALTHYIRVLVEEKRAEEEQERRDKEAKVSQRRLRVNPALVEDPSPVEVEPENDEKIYVEHARLITEALDGDVRELRLRRDEALAAIRRQFPLTHPPEPEMLAKLERLVKRFPRSKPQESPSTPPPKEIDGEKIITIKERP